LIEIPLPQLGLVRYTKEEGRQRRPDIFLGDVGRPEHGGGIVEIEREQHGAGELGLGLGP
jgi:hypothetical protein